MIKRSKEILMHHGLRGYAQAIKNYFLWHPILPESRWYISRFLRSQPQIIQVVHGHKMLVDISIEGIPKKLFLYGIHEPQSTRIFSEIIPKNAKVVDVGANIGYYALIEARVAQKVYAIEPEPNNLELLRKNIALNSYEDILEVHQFAVSDRMGVASLEISDIPNRHRLQVPSAIQSRMAIEVETTTLDAFLENKNIDVIRMDLEGAEWLVINGMKKILRNGKPLILFIEVHREFLSDYGGDARKLLELLFDSGFKVSHLVIREPTLFSIKNCIISDCLPKERAYSFNPIADKQQLFMQFGHIISNYHGYRLFLVRS